MLSGHVNFTLKKKKVTVGSDVGVMDASDDLNQINFSTQNVTIILSR